MASKNPEFMRESVRRWLGGLREGEMKLKQLEQRIVDYRARLELLKAVDYSNASVSTSATNDTMGAAVAMLEEMTEEWQTEVAHVSQDLAEAYRIMDKSSIAGYAVCLHDLIGMHWDDVAIQISYSIRAVHLITDRGYAELYDVMPEYWRREVYPKAI